MKQPAALPSARLVSAMQAAAPKEEGVHVRWRCSACPSRLTSAIVCVGHTFREQVTDRQHGGLGAAMEWDRLVPLDAAGSRRCIIIDTQPFRPGTFFFSIAGFYRHWGTFALLSVIFTLLSLRMPRKATKSTGFFWLYLCVLDSAINLQWRLNLWGEASLQLTTGAGAQLNVPDCEREQLLFHHVSRGFMKILLVDDNLGYLQLLGDLLRDHGYEVSTAEDGKQARESLDMQSVDVIISDVYMPRLDGIWFHSYVREFSGVPDVPFVFVTGGVSNVEDLVVDRNVDYFISKNAPVEELLSLVGNFDPARRLKIA